MRSIEWDLQDLEETVSIVENNRYATPGRGGEEMGMRMGLGLGLEEGEGVGVEKKRVAI